MRTGSDGAASAPRRMDGDLPVRRLRVRQDEVKKESPDSSGATDAPDAPRRSNLRRRQEYNRGTASGLIVRERLEDRHHVREEVIDTIGPPCTYPSGSTVSFSEGRAKRYGKGRAKSLNFPRLERTRAEIEKFHRICVAVRHETKKLQAEENRQRDEIIERLVEEAKSSFLAQDAEQQERDRLKRFEKMTRNRKWEAIEQYLARSISFGMESGMPKKTELGREASATAEWNDGLTRQAATRYTSNDRRRSESICVKRKQMICGKSVHEEETWWTTADQPEPAEFHWQPKLSKAEQNSLRRALNEQKRCLETGQPQRAAGRVHRGPSFKTKPDVILFEDFEVGRVYTKLVEVTNISLSFNTFRIMPLPEELQDVVDVEFAPPGRMSAGSTTTFKVIFKPTRNVRIDSHLPILAPTGREQFTVCCWPMKTVVQFSPGLVEAAEFIQSIMTEQKPRSTVHTAERTKHHSRYETADRRFSRAARSSFSEKPKHVEEDSCTKLLVLDMGNFQLGAVGGCDLHIKNSGALGSQYVVMPIVTDGSKWQFPLPHKPAAVSNDRSSSAPPAEVDTEAKSAELANALGDDGFPSHDMSMDILSGDRLLLEESVSSTHQQALDDLGIASLLCDWSHDVVNLHYLTVENYASSLDAHGSTAIRFNYAPAEPGKFYCVMLLSFKNPLVQKRFILIRGACLAPPVTVENPEHSLNICVPDKCYRQPVVLQNSSESPMKLWVAAPSPVKGELWFDPSSGFVQPGQKFVVTVCFSPKHDFFTRFPQFAQELDEASRQKHCGSTGFCIPVRFEGSDLILPVETTLTGILTRNEVQISPFSLNFGPCAENSAVSLPLVISNPSLLMAEYCFFNLPSAFSVYNALDPKMVCSVKHGTATSSCAVSPTAATANDSGSPLQLKCNDASFSTHLTVAEAGQGALTSWGNLKVESCSAAKTVAADSLLYLQSGVHGWVAPGESHKCLIVYHPDKDLSDAHAGATGPQTEVSSARQRQFYLTLRVMMGIQRAYEASIPARALPLRTPLSLKPSAFLRLPVVPQGEVVTQSLFVHLSPHTFSCGRPHQLSSPLSATAKAAPGGCLSSFSAEGSLRSWQAHSVQGVTSPSAVNPPGAGALSLTERLVVQLLPPPSHLSCLSINPTCFSLSYAQPSQRIAVSFAPTKAFMELTEHAGGQSVKDSGQPIGDEKGLEGVVGTLRPSSPGSPSLAAGAVARVPASTVDDSGETLGVQQHQQKSAKTTPSRPPSKSGGRPPSATSTDAVPCVERKDLQTVQDCDDKKCVGEDDPYKAVVACGGLRWCSATVFSKTGGAEGEEGASSLEEISGGNLCFEQETRSRVLDASEIKQNRGEPIIHSRWKIPVRWRWATQKQAAVRDEELWSTSSATDGGDFSSLTFLEVATCATPQLITASTTSLDFGDVMIGTEARLRCVLRCSDLSIRTSYSPTEKDDIANIEGAVHLLKAVELPLASCFELKNAIRPLTVERPLELLVGFQPRAPQNYRAKLQLVGSLTRQTIELHGRGIDAELLVTPADQDLDFGAVVVPSDWTAGGYGAQAAFAPAGTAQHIFVRNPSSRCKVVFDVTRLAVSHPDVEDPGPRKPASTFACFPLRGTIPPGETQQFIFCFRPTRAEGMYTTVFQVSFENCIQRPHVLRLRGLAVSHQLYAAPYAPLCMKPDISNEEILSSLPRAKSLWERPALLPTISNFSSALPSAAVVAPAPGNSSSAASRTIGHQGKDGVIAGQAPSATKAVSPLQQQHLTADSSGSNSINVAERFLDEESGCDQFVEPGVGVLEGSDLHGQLIELLFEPEKKKGSHYSAQITPALSAGATGTGTRLQGTNEGKDTDEEASSNNLPTVTISASAGTSTCGAGDAPGVGASSCKQPRKKGETAELNSLPLRTCSLIIGAAWSPVPVKSHGKESRAGATSTGNSGARDSGSPQQQQGTTSLSSTGAASGAPPASSAASSTSTASVNGPNGSSPPSAPIVPDIIPLSLSQQPLCSPYGKSKTEVVGSFELILEDGEHSSCFSLEPSKGSLSAGTRQIVQFTFNPNIYKASARTRALLSKVQALESVGQWVQATVKGTLRGGFSGPSIGSGGTSGNSNSGCAGNTGGSGGGTTQEFTIVLKAYRKGPFF